jgi:hypothetical protein
MFSSIVTNVMFSAKAVASIFCEPSPSKQKPFGRGFRRFESGGLSAEKQSRNSENPKRKRLKLRIEVD